MIPCEEGKVRLMGGYSNSSGMVEMCTSGVFKAISDCAWTDKNAETVCTQLGLTRNGSCLINMYTVKPLCRLVVTLYVKQLLSYNGH